MSNDNNDINKKILDAAKRKKERQENMTPEEIEENSLKLAESFDEARAIISTIADQDPLKAWHKLQQEIDTLIQNAPILTEYMRLRPYIERELKKAEYGGATLAELWEEAGGNETGEADSESRFAKLLLAAREAAKKSPKKVLPRIPIEEITFLLDKVNHDFFGMLVEADPNGQMEINLAKSGDPVVIPGILSLNWQEIEEHPEFSITKELDAFDKRCFAAVGSLYVAGYHLVTFNQIAFVMGYGVKPGLSVIKEIETSLRKMAMLWISFTNIAEIDAGYNYELAEHEGHLIEANFDTFVEINGQVSYHCVNILEMPFLFKFAKGRKQIGAVPIRVLDSPKNKTKANIRLEDYLIERILRMAAGRQNNKMLYSSIFKELKITRRDGKLRAKKNIKIYLTYQKEQKFIKDFKEVEDGVIIEPYKTRKPKDQEE